MIGSHRSRVLYDPRAMSQLFGETVAERAEDAAGWQFVRVAVERGLDRTGSSQGSRGGRAGESALTYRTRTSLPVGRRVEVPLGRGDTPSAGIVVEVGGPELAAGLPIGRIKAVTRDTGVGLPGRLVELAQWMAGYYVCPIGMVLATMMPAAVKRGTGKRQRTVLTRGDATLESLGKVTPKTRALVEAVAAVEADAWPIEPGMLAARLNVRTLAPINRLVKLGILRETEFEEVTESGGGAQATLTGHLEAGAEFELTRAQSAIVEGIGAGLDRFGVHLIRGVTGSGKTEVYLELIERVIERGKTALVLVPEISLTPQTAGRFVERFRHRGAGAVAVLHSGLTGSQRHKQWLLAMRSVADGGARIVVGARSAVFAPLENLGLIVVDEEHAGDYKQDQLPRYHGRDVAVKRAQIEGCPVILGSATPSLESWVNATAGAERGAAKYALWELNDRVGGGTLPPVEVVDLADERRVMKQVHPDRNPWFDVIGPTLEHALHATFAAGGQALLLLNRRGYAGYIACPDTTCGYRLTCDDCDALMVHHQWMSVRDEAGGWVRPAGGRGVVRCHHCLAQKLLPQACPICGKRLIRLGMGTQKLEEEIGEKFPELVGDVSPGIARFARADGDTTHSARDWFDVLSRFGKGELKLLLGTQMIAKGLHFPNVRLVGVVSADTALSLPDFRASERTFQLISQVSGRAGRGAAAGRVIVQTMEPHSPAIQHAAMHDYVGFAAGELEVRRRAGLPPITRMARIVVRDRDLGKAQSSGRKIHDALAAEVARRGLSRGASGAIRLMGPMPAPIARIAQHYRIAIEVIGNRRTVIQEVLGAVRSQGWLKSDAHTAVDVDPIAMV